MIQGFQPLTGTGLTLAEPTLILSILTLAVIYASLLDASAISSDQCQCQCCFSGLRIHISFSLINLLDRKF